MVGASVADIRLTGMTERTGNSKGYPYNPAKMPYYYTGIVQKISDEEFRELLGHEIPNGRWSGNLEINDAICQMYYAKSGIARFICKKLGEKLKKSEAAGVPDLNTLFQYNMPVRALAQMTGGMVGQETVDGIVMEAKGFWIIGLLRALIGFGQNAVSNRKFRAALDAERGGPAV